MAANLHGVWAKWDRAIEQLHTLNAEVGVFGSQPNPWGIVCQENRDRGEYVFRLDTNWEPGLVFLWGTILGEIVHDLRSALEQLVSQLVFLNGRLPIRSHSFPVLTKEPPNGFGVHMRREWTDPRGKVRYGPLFGLGDNAVALIEACQPYKGGDSALLLGLHSLWNTDKHQQLIPTTLTGNKPTLHVENAILMYREDRFDGDTYVIEVGIAEDGSGLDPKVDVEPHAPDDILLSEGGPGPPVIRELQAVAQFILTDILIPAVDLFPAHSGLGHPVPERLGVGTDPYIARHIGA